MNLNEKKGVVILSPSFSHPLTEHTRVVLVNKSSDKGVRMLSYLEYSEELEPLISEGLADSLSINFLLNFYYQNRKQKDI